MRIFIRLLVSIVRHFSMFVKVRQETPGLHAFFVQKRQTFSCSGLCGRRKQLPSDEQELPVHYSGISLLFPAVPAVGAELFLRNTHCIEHIIQPVVPQSGKIQLLADFLDHLIVLRRLRIRVFGENLL